MPDTFLYTSSAFLSSGLNFNLYLDKPFIMFENSVTIVGASLNVNVPADFLSEYTPPVTEASKSFINPIGLSFPSPVIKFSSHASAIASDKHNLTYLSIHLAPKSIKSFEIKKNAVKANCVNSVTPNSKSNCPSKSLCNGPNTAFPFLLVLITLVTALDTPKLIRFNSGLSFLISSKILSMIVTGNNTSPFKSPLVLIISSL